MADEDLTIDKPAFVLLLKLNKKENEAEKVIFIKIIITLLFTLFSFKISEDKYDFFLPMAGII